MDRAQLNILQKEVLSLNELFNKLQEIESSDEKVIISSKLNTKILEIKSKLPQDSNKSSITRKICEDFSNVIDDYENYLRELQSEEEEGRDIVLCQAQSLNFDEEKRKHDVELLVEANKLSKELIYKQKLANDSIKKHSDELEYIITDTEKTINTGKQTVANLAEASRRERRKRGEYFIAGSTALGGIFGKMFGGVLGSTISGGIVDSISIKHDKKMNRVMKMS